MATTMKMSRDYRLNEIILQPDMQAVLQHAPDILHILRFASLQTDGQDRWQMYEALKHLASLRVGFYARHPAVQECWHYETVIKAIDALLPDESEMEGDLAS